VEKWGCNKDRAETKEDIRYGGNCHGHHIVQLNKLGVWSPIDKQLMGGCEPYQEDMQL